MPVDATLLGLRRPLKFRKSIQPSLTSIPRDTKASAKTFDLFPTDAVPSRFPASVSKRIPGLANLGNSCFFNSIVQCLMHIPQFRGLIAENELLTLAAPQFSDSEFDVIKEWHQFSNVYNVTDKRVVAPRRLLRTVPKVSADEMRAGVQQDAHEFLIKTLDAMHERSLKKFRELKKLGPKEDNDTTFVRKVFGGTLTSRVKCSECGFTSNRCEQFSDLALDMRSSVKSSLKAYTEAEVLDGENKWECERCEKKVKATKKLLISMAPNVLTVQLKRFDFSGRKRRGKCKFSNRLTLPSGETYKLRSIVVHEGYSVGSGHYVAYVRGLDGVWRMCDDETVCRVSPQMVKKQDAYLLFYSKTPDDEHESEREASTASNETTSTTFVVDPPTRRKRTRSAAFPRLIPFANMHVWRNRLFSRRSHRPAAATAAVHPRPSPESSRVASEASDNDVLTFEDFWGDDQSTVGSKTPKSGYDAFDAALDKGRVKKRKRNYL